MFRNIINNGSFHSSYLWGSSVTVDTNRNCIAPWSKLQNSSISLPAQCVLIHPVEHYPVSTEWRYQISQLEALQPVYNSKHKMSVKHSIMWGDVSLDRIRNDIHVASVHLC